MRSLLEPIEPFTACLPDPFKPAPKPFQTLWAKPSLSSITQKRNFKTRAATIFTKPFLGCGCQNSWFSKKDGEDRVNWEERRSFLKKPAYIDQECYGRLFDSWRNGSVEAIQRTCSTTCSKQKWIYSVKSRHHRWGRQQAKVWCA